LALNADTRIPNPSSLGMIGSSSFTPTQARPVKMNCQKNAFIMTECNQWFFIGILSDAKVAMDGAFFLNYINFRNVINMEFNHFFTLNCLINVSFARNQKAFRS
jgi:hypothetical protein